MPYFKNGRNLAIISDIAQTKKHVLKHIFHIFAIICTFRLAMSQKSPVFSRIFSDFLVRVTILK